MGIGIEIELRTYGIQFREICIALEKRFTNLQECINGFVNPIIDGKKYNICVMAKDEHYRHTIEFNIYPMSGNLKNLKETQDFIQHLTSICYRSDRNLLTIFSDCPEFVGLHIHMFMKGALKIRHNAEILNKMSYFTMAYFQYELWKEFIRDDLSAVQRLELFSDMYRGVKNHTIMRHYDRHVLNDTLTKIMSKYGIEWHYGVNFGTGSDKIKYSPVIFSALRRNGKRTSIESRYSFNYFAKWNIEVLMRYIKIMEQTDWANVHVKGNLEALYEMTCILVNTNARLLNQGNYWNVAQHALPIAHKLPKEITLLPLLKPEITKTFEPEVMLNGKIKKPTFTTPLTSELLNYCDGRRTFNVIPIQAADRIDCPSCTSNSGFRTLSGDYSILQFTLSSVELTPLPEQFFIYNNVLFQLCEARGTISNTVRDNYYFALAKRANGRLNAYLVNKTNDIFIEDAQSIMNLTTINPLDYFESLNARPSIPPARASVAPRTGLGRPPSESETLSYEEAMEIERIWSDRLENQLEEMPIPYRRNPELEGAKEMLMSYDSINGIYDKEEFENHSYVEDFQVHNLHCGEKLFFNKSLMYYNAHIVGTEMAVKVLRTEDVGISSHDDYRFVETYSTLIGKKPMYFLVHCDLLSLPIGTSEWKAQVAIPKFRLYCKLKQEDMLPVRPQDPIPRSETTTLMQRARELGLHPGATYTLSTPDSSRERLIYVDEATERITEINNLANNIQRNAVQANTLYGAGLTGAWLEEPIPPSNDIQPLGETRF